MTYPRTLDEFTQQELETELERRNKLRAKNLCDYCGRGPLEEPCKFRHRHLFIFSKYSDVDVLAYVAEQEKKQKQTNRRKGLGYKL